MDYPTYLATTMMKAGTKIVPFVVSIVVGYYVFIKLPFWFFRNTMRDARRQDPLQPDFPKFPDEPKFMKLEDKIKRDAEEVKREQQKFQQQNRSQKKEEPKKEEPKKEKREERREIPKRPAADIGVSPESVFELLPGQKLSPSELKSRYHELLKQSHPDRVASMGPDFKKLAEKKTKEINEAYARLKKKAS
ncbi:MAG: J domain-containing protein [Bdellovibrionota bacterium]